MLNKFLKLTPQTTPWYSLNNKIIKNRIVHLRSYSDPRTMNPLDNPKFLCKILFVDQCDKNFVYYFIDKHIFPNVEKLYLSSPIVNDTVLLRFDDIEVTEYGRKFVTIPIHN